MSTLKTILTTVFVLLLGAVLLSGGWVLWSQYQSIQTLRAQVSSLQKQTDDTSTRLSKTIQTSNNNFRSLNKREGKLSDIIVILGKLIISNSGQDLAAYNPNTRASNEVTITPSQSPPLFPKLD